MFLNRTQSEGSYLWAVAITDVIQTGSSLRIDENHSPADQIADAAKDFLNPNHGLRTGNTLPL